MTGPVHSTEARQSKNNSMKDLKKYIRDKYPRWHAQKSIQQRPEKTTRETNARRHNARQIAMQPQYITTEPPQA